MKTAILTFEQFLGKKGVGSSRIRAHWLIKNWKLVGKDIGDIELFQFGQKYDAVIFQKAYFVEFAREFKGLKILDLCDPDWLIWNSRMKEMIEVCDVITCSSLELTRAVSKFTKKSVYFVPDRVDLSSLPYPKVHSGETKKVVWYGYSQNFDMLNAAVKVIHDLKLELIVISDGVYAPPASLEMNYTNLPFSEATYLADIQSGDIVINPRWVKGKWKYKSDNKTSIAKALGMPVAHDEKELKALLTEESRKKACEEGLFWVMKERDVKQSVEDMKEIMVITQNAKSVV